jgi:hypothetical protein
VQYCEGGAWKAAVKMYRRAGLWEDVVRVAKAHGGPAASKQVLPPPLTLACTQAIRS